LDQSRGAFVYNLIQQVISPMHQGHAKIPCSQSLRNLNAENSTADNYGSSIPALGGSFFDLLYVPERAN